MVTESLSTAQIVEKRQHQHTIKCKFYKFYVSWVICIWQKCLWFSIHTHTHTIINTHTQYDLNMNISSLLLLLLFWLPLIVDIVIFCLFALFWCALFVGFFSTFMDDLFVFTFIVIPNHWNFRRKINHAFIHSLGVGFHFLVNSRNIYTYILHNSAIDFSVTKKVLKTNSSCA